MANKEKLQKVSEEIMRFMRGRIVPKKIVERASIVQQLIDTIKVVNEDKLLLS